MSDWGGQAISHSGGTPLHGQGVHPGRPERWTFLETMVSIGLNIDYSNLQHDAEKCATRMLSDDIYLIWPGFRVSHFSSYTPKPSIAMERSTIFYGKIHY